MLKSFQTETKLVSLSRPEDAAAQSLDRILPGPGVHRPVTTKTPIKWGLLAFPLAVLAPPPQENSGNHVLSQSWPPAPLRRHPSSEDTKDTEDSRGAYADAITVVDLSLGHQRGRLRPPVTLEMHWRCGFWEGRLQPKVQIHEDTAVASKPRAHTSVTLRVSPAVSHAHDHPGRGVQRAGSTARGP